MILSSGIDDSIANKVGSHVGKGIGIVLILRSTMYHASRGNIYMPTELLIKVWLFKKKGF